MDIFMVPALKEGASQVVLVVKNPPANAGHVRNVSSTPGLRRSPGGGHGNPLQYSHLENAHKKRSLTGYNPWGHKEMDTTEPLSTARCVNFCCSKT